MPVPPFVRELRTRVGHDLLHLPGVAAIVFDDAGRVLLGRRADTGRWHTIGGIVEPGEEPADCCVREVFEETGVRCRVDRLVGVYTTPHTTYPNGDHARYVVVAFACRAVGGDVPRVADDESLDVRYFALTELPADLPAELRERIGDARSASAVPFFRGGGTYNR